MTATTDTGLVGYLRQYAYDFPSLGNGGKLLMHEAASQIEADRARIASLSAENAILRDMLLNPDPDQEPDNIRLHREKCNALDKLRAAEARLASMEAEVRERQGWVLAPLEPTSEMVRFGEDGGRRVVKSLTQLEGRKFADAAYKAMIAAAIRSGGEG